MTDIEHLARQYVGEVHNTPRIRGRETTARRDLDEALRSLQNSDDDLNDGALAELARHIRDRQQRHAYAADRVRAQNDRFRAIYMDFLNLGVAARRQFWMLANEIAGDQAPVPMHYLNISDADYRASFAGASA